MQMKLTPKQIEVLQLGTEGLSNKEIGLVLGVSDETVKTHVRAIIKATGARRAAWWKIKEVQVTEPAVKVKAPVKRPKLAPTHVPAPAPAAWPRRAV